MNHHRKTTIWKGLHVGKKVIIRRKQPASVELAAMVTAAPTKKVDPPPPLAMDIPGFDRAERPPVVGNYQGKTALTDDTGEVIVTLDRGAYRMLWETMEAAALSNWRKYDSAAPAVSQASQRALRAVRSASVQYLVPAEPPKRKIRVKKK